MWKSTRTSSAPCAPLLARRGCLPAAAPAGAGWLVDVLPAAAALAGASAASATASDTVPLAGRDLSPLLEQPWNASRGKSLAFSQYPRCHDPLSADPLWSSNGCSGTEPDTLKFKFFGYSVRSDAWRYTEWRTWNRAKLSPTSWDAPPYARELYAHAGDDGSNYSKFENVNVAEHAANVALWRS